MLLPGFRRNLRRPVPSPYRRARLSVEPLERRELLSLAPTSALAVPVPVQSVPASSAPATASQASATLSLGSATVTISAFTTVGTLPTGLSVSILVVTLTVSPGASDAAASNPGSSFTETIARSTTVVPANATNFNFLQFSLARTAPGVIPPVLFLTPAAPTQVSGTPTTSTTTPAWSAFDPGYFIAGDEETLIELSKPPRRAVKPEQVPPAPVPREGAAADDVVLPHAPALTAYFATEADRVEIPLPPPPPVLAQGEPTTESLALSSVVALLGYGFFQGDVARERARQPERRPRQKMRAR